MGEAQGKDMQNILDAPQHAMLTSILCIRNSLEPVKYRATYITYALSAAGHTRTLARKCACVLRKTAIKWQDFRFHKTHAMSTEHTSTQSKFRRISSTKTRRDMKFGSIHRDVIYTRKQSSKNWEIVVQVFINLSLFASYIFFTFG